MENLLLINRKYFVLIILLFLNGNLFSQSVLSWHRYPGNPVLDIGVSGAWDDSSAGVSCVLYHDNMYHMWYEGNMENGIGYATSPDGIFWTRDSANPVLTQGADTLWDGLSISNASVVFADNVYKMWYMGLDDDHDSRIGSATSPDGIFWTKNSANPVLDLGQPGDWDSNEAMHPWVIYDNGTYKMYYNGHDGSEQRILYADSPDGLTWNKFMGHPILEPGIAGQWDENKLGPMTVVNHDSMYHMWYMAWNFSHEFAIGHATSLNGLDWTKDTLNPVLTAGDSGSWDDTYVAVPSVIWNDSVCYMWYGGFDGTFGRTGLASGSPFNSIKNNKIIKPSNIYLYGNYPNPFNPETKIHYRLTKKSKLRLNIYNILGKTIKTLINDVQAANEYWINWDATNLPSGLYFYEITIEEEKQNGKMLLLK
jgi:predicted GH43/DUF377 family glycosyl hydrolase